MPFQVSQHYSLWSFPECSIPYFFACPACRKIWPVLHTHNYNEGSPPLKIPLSCPDCNRNGEAFVESQTGFVEEIRTALAAKDIERSKDLVEKEGYLPGLFRLNLKHSYLDMRVIAWENGGPAPCNETPPDGWPVFEEFEKSISAYF